MILADYPGHLIAAALLAVVAALLALTYRAEGARYAGRWRWILGGLRYVALAALIVVIWNPSRILKTETTARNTVLVVFDTSESMSIADCDGRSRLDEAIRIFRESLRPGCPERPRYRVYGFDTSCYESGVLEALHRWGPRTNLRAACALLSNRPHSASGGKTSGVVVFTDGQAEQKLVDSYLRPTDKETRFALIGVGSPELHDNLAITSIEAPPRATIDTAYDVQVQVSATCSEPMNAAITLLKDESVIGVRQLRVAGGGSDVTVAFRVLADRLGEQCFEARIELSEGEVNLADNVRRTTVQVIEPPFLKALLYSQVLNSDIGKVRSALARDKRVRLDVALDVIKGSALSDMAGAASGYASLPRDAAGFRKYDAIILGPCSMDSFSATQIEGLYSFVAERGGGLILLPGRGQYSMSNSSNKLIRALIPAEFLLAARGYPVSAENSLQLTADGIAQGLLEGDELSAYSPTASVFYAGLAPKPAASTLAVSDGAPIVVAHRVGRGRVCIVNTYGLLRWYREDLDGGLLRKFMSGLTVWASRIVSQEASIELLAQRPRLAPGNIVFDAYVHDEDYSRVPDASVLLHFHDQVIRMAQQEDGHYTARFENVLHEAVLARCEAQKSGRFLGEKTLTANLPVPRTEMDRVELDRRFLQKLALRMGGTYFDAEEVDSGLADMFPATTKTVQNSMVSAWACWPLLVALCGVLSINWFLRRSIGLL